MGGAHRARKKSRSGNGNQIDRESQVRPADKGNHIGKEAIVKAGIPTQNTGYLGRALKLGKVEASLGGS